MTSNKDLIDAELGTLPPSTVDVDQVMRRQDQRMRLQKVGIGGALGVMMVAFAAGFTMLPRAGTPVHNAQPGSAPKATATPTPTPSSSGPNYSAMEDRFTAALAEVPKSLHVPTNAKFSHEPSPGGGAEDYYLVHWKTNGVDYSITIQASDKGHSITKVNGCRPPYVGEMACKRQIDNRGVQYTLYNAIDKIDGVHKKSSALELDYFQYDGTEVLVSENAGGGHWVLPLSNTAAMSTAAHNPAFTLQP